MVSYSGMKHEDVPRQDVALFKREDFTNVNYREDVLKRST